MVQRINFDLLTNLGSVADPLLLQDASTKNYVDTNALQFADILGNQITTITGAITAGTSLVSLTGDFRSSLPNGSVVGFANNPNGNVRYTISGIQFVGGFTDFTITPSATLQIPNGTGIALWMRTPFTDVAAGSGISTAVSSNILTIGNSAQTQINNGTPGSYTIQGTGGITVGTSGRVITIGGGSAVVSNILGAQVTTINTTIPAAGTMVSMAGDFTSTFVNNAYCGFINDPNGNTRYLISGVTFAGGNTTFTIPAVTLAIPTNTGIALFARNTVTDVISGSGITLSNTSGLLNVTNSAQTQINNATPGSYTVVGAGGTAINTVGRTITISSPTSGMVTAVPVLNFTSSATPSAGQTFTNAAFAEYQGADYITVTFNGSVLNRSDYSLSGTTLTISVFLPASSAIQIQPTASGSSGNSWLLGGNTIPGASSYFGSNNAADVLMGSSSHTQIRMTTRYIPITLNTTGLSSGNAFYFSNQAGNRALIGTNYYTTPSINSQTFTQQTGSSAPDFTGRSPQFVAQVSRTDFIIAYQNTANNQQLGLIYSTGINAFATSNTITWQAPSLNNLSGLLGADVSQLNSSGNRIFAIAPLQSGSLNLSDVERAYYCTYSPGTNALSAAVVGPQTDFPVTEVLFDATQANILYVVTTQSVYSLNTDTNTQTRIGTHNGGQIESALQLGNTLLLLSFGTVAGTGGIWQISLNPPGNATRVFSYNTNNWSNATADYYSDAAVAQGIRFYGAISGSNNSQFIELTINGNNDLLTSTAFGDVAATTFNAALLAGNASTPTAFTAGSAEQVLKSRGPSLSPYWGNTIQFVTGTVAASTIPSGTNQIINWTGLTTLPTGWTYLNGTFTNNSGFTQVVCMEVSLPFTNLGSTGECDVWWQIGTARAGQVVFPSQAAGAQNIANFSTTAFVPTGSTVTCRAFGNGSGGIQVGSSVFAAATRMTLRILG